MAGRPLGMKSLVNALSRYSKVQLRKLIASIPSKNEMVVKLERQREKLAKSIAKLTRRIEKLSGGNGSVAAAAPSRHGRKPGRRKGYTLSAETRRKMSEAAKRRYAGKSTPAASTEPRKKRTVSPEARAKMAAAARARWAKVKGAAEPTS